MHEPILFVKTGGIAGPVEELVSHRKAQWSVEAFDAAGEEVGADGAPRRLLISRGLGGR